MDNRLMIMRKTIFIAVFLFRSIIFAQNIHYFSDFRNDTLVLGNRFTTIQCHIGNGEVDLVSVMDKTEGLTCSFLSGSKLFCIDGLKSPHLNTTVTKNIHAETPVRYACQETDIVSEFDQYEVKRCFRVFASSPVITCDFYIRKKNAEPLFLPSETSYLFDLSTYSSHWKLRSIEFFDQTDNQNNPVSETDKLSYRKEIKMRGNVLIATDLLANQALLFIKEAPCSFVQLHYPGYDFVSEKNRLKAVNFGITADDLPEGTWVKTYSVAFCLTAANELDELTALRTYQKHFRRTMPYRDEMIMMNTWGDRNEGGNINEQFVKKEIDACAKLGVSHFQIDDGWQSWSTYDSAKKAAFSQKGYEQEDWLPSLSKFPGGLEPLSEYAQQNKVRLGLWFAPNKKRSYENWKTDAVTLINLYNRYKIGFFKIDDVTISDKRSEINFRHLLDSVSVATGNQVVFDLDVTASRREGYYYFYEYGNLFLENRYTDWANYYPYQTLRTLWLLSKYVAPERLQIEFLNKWRNADKYPSGDPFAPSAVPFEYIFAITMAGQPLAWFEGSKLNPEGFLAAPLIKKYRGLMADIHSGYIFPIGEEPDGKSFTGFQSIKGDEGYMLVFRECTNDSTREVKTWIPKNSEVQFELISGKGHNFCARSDDHSYITFSLPELYSYALYKYRIIWSVKTYDKFKDQRIKKTDE